MNRVLLFIAFFLFSLASWTMDIDKSTATALEHINQGYIQYAFDELKKIAATNGIAAQFYVAVCYEHGIGVEKNEMEAFKMYRKAAERGLPDAMYHIASFYGNGIVVTQDTSREKEWIQRFNHKGGKLLLPDLITYYNEGVKHSGNYALNPHTSNSGSSNLVTRNNKKATPIKQIARNTPIVQTNPTPIVSKTRPQLTAAAKKSDVDTYIPDGSQVQKNTFALVIANENYQEVAKVPNALNDGKIFAEYCSKTLGLPKNNIKLVQDATLNNIRRQLNWLKQVMEAYQGEANVIFYYAGHGIPDESNGSSYLLPVDGIGNDASSGYSLEHLYSELSSKPAKSVLVLLDACFSGAMRDGGMLASARGVAIKAKQNAPKGNLVVLSAAQGDETAYPYTEKGHGLFTYYLLKKIQETKGNVTFGKLAEYVTSEVKKQSVLSNGKMQTPTVTASQTLVNSWKNMKLK